ncbi:MAG: diacylglycerol kinase [Gammaproteobacteria bacterium]
MYFFTRIIKAIGYSIQGLKAAYQHEMAFKQELLLGLFWLPVVYCLSKNVYQGAWLISAWVLVLIVELLNSGIEAVVNRIGTERHELSGRAKDLGSAAVFLSMLHLCMALIAVVSENYIFN